MTNGNSGPAAGPPATVTVQLVRGLIGANRRQRRVVEGLGLRRRGRTVVRPDTPEIRGMIRKVSHLVRVLPDAASDGAPAAKDVREAEKAGDASEAVE